MVFLRPVVVRDANATESLSINRYQQMQGLQLNAQPSNHLLLNTHGSAVLPSAPGTVPAQTTAPESTAPTNR
jgi:general secretion pathway protein D